MSEIKIVGKEAYEALALEEKEKKKSNTMTQEQEAVTKARNCDILVSAAAGSGKTWVLVKRIIKRIVEDRVEVNEFLIVTFTKAAAAEMRERIGKAIEETLLQAIAEEVDEELINFLKKQTTLVYQAQISTIDSFCSDVVKQYFMTINLDPNIRIAEEAELAVLRSEVMEQVLEAEYQKKEEAFLHFVESYASGRNDTKIENIIYDLYQFSMAHPSAEAWLTHAMDNMEQDVLWYEVILEHARYVMEAVCEIQHRTLAYAKEYGASEKAVDAIEEDGIYLKQLLQACCIEDVRKAYDSIRLVLRSHGRYPTMNTRGMEPENATQLKALRDGYKDTVKKELEGDMFELERTELDANRKAVIPDMTTLFRLCMQFHKAFSEEKRNQHIADFADIEHMALSILTETNADGERIPSAIALQLKQQYKEIMIDEYQDSNFLQEAILESIAGGNESGYNRFMVGDMKQSIYRFRMASPELFVGKYQAFEDYQETEQKNQVKIELDCNFRSSSNVLKTSNYLFYHVMKQSVGNIEYDQKAALKTGARYETPVICPEYAGITKEQAEKYCYNNDTELLLYEIGADCDETVDLITEEARMIASKIKEIMGENPMLVKDSALSGPENTQYRKVCYRDIVILLRSPSSYSETFVKVLAEYGIPAFAESRTGYFSAMEVRNVLSYLTILNNSTIDISVVAVLRSGFYQVSAKEMAFLQVQTEKELPFIQKIWQYIEDSKNGEYEGASLSEQFILRNKLKQFQEDFLHYQKLAKQLTVCELLQILYEETGYLDFVSTLPAGERRKANLYMLLEKAKEYEKTNFCGVFEFIRYIERLRKYEVDYAEASLLGEEDDVVRIMSIHKSKGLEFPVVFLSGLSKQFNEMDNRASIVVHADLGVGPYLLDPVMRTRQKTIMRSAIQLVSHNDMLGEELRILYVALTRAKDKLYLSGAVKQYEAVLKKVPFRISYVDIVSAHCYLDWVMMAFGHHHALTPLFREYGLEPPEYDENRYEAVCMKLCCYNKAMLDEMQFREEVKQTIDAQMLKCKALAVEEDKIERLKEYLAYEYQYENITKQKGKYSVSQLKMSQVEENKPHQLQPVCDVAEEIEITEKVPRFLMEQQKMTGAMSGTVVHKFMELYDFSKGYSEKEYERVVQELEKRNMQIKHTVLSQQKVKQFFDSQLAKQMVHANNNHRLYKEVQFVAGFPIADMAQDIGLDEEKVYTEETILVQGIIDAYYQREDGTYVIMDYKTDRVANSDELVKRYKKQLQYYARTLKQVKEAEDVECMIYSFCLAKDIIVDLEDETKKE